MPEIAITRAGAERIDDVEPLWHALHRHHRSVAGHLTAVAPFRSDDESWVRRRAFYERLLARPDSFFLLAEREGRLVGYAAVGVSGTEATLEVGDRVGELESPRCCLGAQDGLGGRLMDAVFDELRRLGVEEIALAVMEGNEDAARFYERRGLVPISGGRSAGCRQLRERRVLAGVVAPERRERDRRERHTDDAEHTSRDDRGPDPRERRHDAGLQVPDQRPRRVADLLDPGEGGRGGGGDRGVPDRPAEDATDHVRRACEGERGESEREIRRENRPR